MKKILDYPDGPVFIQGRLSDIRLKLWHGKRAKYVNLTARAARRLACALLLEAEKLEVSTEHKYQTPKTLKNSIDRAVDALVRIHIADEKLRIRRLSHPV